MAILLRFGFFALGSGFLSLFSSDATLIEAIHATGGVHNALFAGVMRMTLRADVNADIWHRGLRFDFAATRQAHNGGFLIIGMNIGFHFGFNLPYEFSCKFRRRRQ